MQLPEVTLPTPLLPRAASAPNPSVTSASTPMATVAAAPSPSTQVVLGPVNASAAESAVYTKPTITVIYLRESGSAQSGPIATQVSKTLSSHLQTLNENTAPFSAGLFFSQAGALSRETSSYFNEARSRQVAGDIAPEKARPDFTLEAGKVTSSATLNIRTRDGDTINITLAYKGDSKHLNFSFHVEGELSEEEQLALEKLAAKLGEVADEFFRSGTAELRGLDEFDSDTFASFSLSLSKYNGKDYDTFDYDYAIDETTGTARLSGQDVFGYKFDISAHLSGLLNQPPTAHQSLEQYLTLIRKAGDDQDAESSSVRFMVDGLRSMLMTKVREPSEADIPYARVLENYATGLPDFTATFSSTRAHNPAHYAHISSMNLNMGQTTHLETVNNRVLIQQESFYELNRNHWEALPGLTHADIERGNYVYVNEHIRESTSRTLDINAGRIADIFIESELQWRRKEQAFIDFKAQQIYQDEDSDSKLINLMDHFNPHVDEATNQRNLLQLLDKSRANFFKGW